MGTNIRNLAWLILVGAAAAALVHTLLRATRPCCTTSPAPFTGNPASEVFHRHDCALFDADPIAPRFAARDEAVAAGYRPCRICHP